MDWSPILANALLLVIGIIGIVLSGLATLAVKALAKKYNLQNTDLLLTNADALVSTAVHAAEAWAEKAAVKPTGNEKMDYAIKVVRTAATNPLVQQWTDEHVKKVIEAKLYEVINKYEPASTTDDGK